MNLVTFLRARIDEARIEATEAALARDTTIANHGFLDGLEPEVPDYSLSWTEDVIGGAVVLMGPERVLAQCDARTHLIDRYVEVMRQVRAMGRSVDLRTATNSAVLRLSLQYLADEYTWHPDHQKDWTP